MCINNVHDQYFLIVSFLFVCVCLKELSVVLVRADGTLKSPLRKLLSVSATEDLLKKTGAKPGDLLLIAAGSLHTVVRDMKLLCFCGNAVG